MTNASAHLAEIYTLLCRSGLNKEYYGNVLHRTQRLNDVLEILIAVGTAGSGISALTIWQIQPYGPWVWGTLTTIAALLAIAKPIIQLNKRIERLTRLYVGHTDNYTSLVIIVSRIRRHNDVTSELIGSFEAAEARFLELAKEDDPRPNMKLLQRCEAMIRQRHPPDEAWWPNAAQDASARLRAIDEQPRSVAAR
jgi:hypothetical protein